jgi:hypothetical protein
MDRTIRTIRAIANEITSDWKKPYFGAVPYLEAMRQLGTMKDMYGCDSADEVVTYFLSNATNWRGDVARRVKAELNAMLKAQSKSAT